jgi:hypothetical protein|tara:strand:- start:600 stop:968 length:369 start_codon:yes stop_codon:yes gene_type:complete
MKYAFDIDGTICTNREDVREEMNDDTITYLDMKPYADRIQLINDLYDQGHEIIYWTGRGGDSFKDDPHHWYDDTEKQLQEWGAKYHELVVGGKPWFDMYICDKSWNSETWFPIAEKFMINKE